MKSMIRWSAKASLAGGAVLSALLLNALSVLALTPEQIVQKLGPIPVFTLTDDKGAPLVSNPPQGQKSNPISRVFLSQKDAQDFLARLKAEKPDLAKSLQVRPLSMAEVYELKMKSKNNPTQLDFIYIPTRKQSEAALALANAAGAKLQAFPGTPLFVARAGSDKEKGLLTIQQGNETAIPMFFEKEQLQTFIDRFKQSQPDLSKTADIQVLLLENILDAMQSPQKDASLEQLILIPNTEAIQFLQTLRPAGAAPKPGAAPAPGKPAPAPAKAK
jgi:Tic22-like family